MSSLTRRIVWPIGATALLMVSACGGDASSSSDSSIQIDQAVSEANAAADAAPDPQAEAGATEAGDEPSTTPTTPTTPPPTAADGGATLAPRPAVGSDDAAAFKELGPSVATLPARVERFILAADDARIDQLAATACATVEVGTTQADLGVRGLELYELLEPAERSQLAVDEWALLYGALLGFYCPDDLPTPDPGAAGQAGETTVAQFRAAADVIAALPPEVQAFVDGATDERLDELQRAACAGTEATMTSEEFGQAIAGLYRDLLTDTERDSVTIEAFSELYGAMVGWFCNDELPR